MGSFVQVDTLIIGAGVIGSSVAMALSQLGVESICVIDPDLEGTFSSSELNAGGVRATFNSAINIELGKQSIDFFKTISDEVGYRDCGYLWLMTGEQLKQREKSLELWKKHDWKVDFKSVQDLKSSHPFIDKTQDLAGAFFAPRDGLINTNLLKQYFRNRAKAKGVTFVDGAWIAGSESTQDKKIKVTLHRSKNKLTENEKEGFFLGGKIDNINVSDIIASRVVNCAGAWASQVAHSLGYECQSYPQRRQVCIFDSRDVDLSPYGMIVDTSGVYFHPEATQGLAGFAIEDEPKLFNFKYDGEDFFQEHIWAHLHERSTQFEKLKHRGGWAGLYEVSPDHSAILGQVSSNDRIYEAHSFSGRGVMQSYTAGVELAHKIVNKKYLNIDGEILSGDRFNKGQLLLESAII